MNVLVGAEIIMALLGKYRRWGRREVAYKKIRVSELRVTTFKPFLVLVLKPALDERRMRARPPGQRTGTKRRIERLAHRPRKHKLYARAHLLGHVVLDVLPVRPREDHPVGARAVRAQHLFLDPADGREASAERYLGISITCQKFPYSGRFHCAPRQSWQS